MMPHEHSPFLYSLRVGVLLSAGTDGRYDPNQELCTPEVSLKLGTSMSTPTAAGSAALVRDYFMKGFYPTGKLHDADHGQEPAVTARPFLRCLSPTP